MRQRLIGDGASELSYEIRGIVKKAEQLQKYGKHIYWENIGDPIQKHNQVPLWMKNIVINLLKDNDTYGYCHSKGVYNTREYLAEMTNQLGGVQITADDILFFNGLGDAIAKLYQYIIPTSRVIGPSPAYSTHSSAEAAHANHNPITYRLNPENNWYPDLDELYLKVKYNPNIVSILIINPDNPTGMVYPLEVLERIVEIAKEFDLFLVSDEIYTNITYNGAQAHPLSTIIGDVPGIAMKGISKELPWPGSRCGWIEYYNRDKDPEFNSLCQTLDNAKMIEVCSTKLPQLAIPHVFSHPEYKSYREQTNKKIGQRSKIITDILKSVPGLTFNETFGAFYNTIIFNDGVLHNKQTLKIDHPEVKKMVEDEWITDDMPNDKRFIYYLLAAKGICAVPISSFASNLQGFRVTLLEEDEELLQNTFTMLKDAVEEYLAS
ncbi:pyridoxal phosphate-dependent aminotransferase [Chondrinema litorale]|uniref:pyridoxal phosphate-dependent aminotransferase n=1 Tax=Chondrinema litorale TaxID=2994555 RepID=UPI002543520D|nr:pyridoxal phosphate-dependent aminotransferase [Chondrinema litorale]UZR92984.1 pyridoxal phosphate-dependent aminotransferase [Chondrinema litorale]